MGTNDIKLAPRLRRAFVLLLLLLLFLLAGCGKKVGDPCQSGYVFDDEPVCEGHDLWICSAWHLRPGNAGTWEKTSCKGAKGCGTPKGDEPACDVSGSSEGDPCAYDVSACSAAEPKALLACSGKKLVKTICPGSCVFVNGHRAMCVLE